MFVSHSCGRHRCRGGNIEGIESEACLLLTTSKTVKIASHGGPFTSSCIVVESEGSRWREKAS